MDILCQKCSTEYEFDESIIPDSGINVKCVTCNHVFRVLKPALVTPGRQWLINLKKTEEVVSFSDWKTIQEWIKVQKVEIDDEISGTGERWKKIGDIPELESFFIISSTKDDSQTNSIRSAAKINNPNKNSHPTPIHESSKNYFKSTGHTIPMFSSISEEDHQKTIKENQFEHPGLTEQKQSPKEEKTEIIHPSHLINEQTENVPKSPTPVETVKTKDPNIIKNQNSVFIPGEPIEDHSKSANKKIIEQVDHNEPKDQYAKSSQSENKPKSKSEQEYASSNEQSSNVKHSENIPEVSSESHTDTWAENTLERKFDNAVKEDFSYNFGVSDEEDDDLDFNPNKSKHSIYIFTAALLLIFCGAIAYFLFFSGISEHSIKKFEESKKLYYLDKLTESSQALDKLLKTEKNYIDAKALLAQSQITLGGYLREEAYDKINELKLYQKLMMEVQNKKVNKTKNDAEAIEYMESVPTENQMKDMESYANNISKESKNLLKAGATLAKDIYKEHPENVRVLLALADYQRIVTPNSTKYEKYLNKIESLDKNNEEMLFIHGSIAFNKKKYKEAISFLTEAISKNQSLLKAYYYLGRTNERKKDNNAAISQYKLIINKNSSHKWANNKLNKLNKSKEKTKKIETIVAKPKTITEKKLDKNIIKKNVIKNLPKIVKRTPVKVYKAKPKRKKLKAKRVKNINKLLANAQKLQNSGKCKRALKVAKKIIAIQPNNDKVYTIQGWCYYDLENVPKALSSFRKAISKNSKSADAYLGIAEIYMEKGNKAKARDGYTKYLKYNPNGEDANLAKRNLKNLK